MLIPVHDRNGRANLGHALESVGLIELIQVAADAQGPDTRGREFRSLEEMRALLPTARRLLLTLTRDALPSRHPDGIDVMPAYEWLLETQP